MANSQATTQNGTNVSNNVKNAFFSDKITTFEISKYETKKDVLTAIFEPNSIVIVKTNSSNYEALNFGYLSNNNEKTVIKEILKYTLSDARLQADFFDKHEKTGLKNRALFKKYLNTDKIYTVDKKGKISNNIIISETKLKDTGLNVPKKHDLITIKFSPEFEAAVLNNYVNAVLWQFKKFSLLRDSILSYDTLFSETDIVARRETANNLTVSEDAVAQA